MQKTCGQQVVRKYLSIVNKCENYMCMHLDDDLDDFFKISKVLQENNMVVEAIEEDITNISKKELPAIAQIKEDSKEHFILILKVTKNKITYYDPNYGIVLCKLNDFKEICLNKFLITKQKTKAKIKRNLPSFITKSELSIIITFFVAELLSSIGLFVYIDLYKNQVILFVSLLILISTIIGHIFYLLKVNKKIDKNIIFRYMNENKIQKSENFKNIMKLKGESFYKINMFFINLTTLLFFLIVIALKDIDQLYVVSFFIILYLLFDMGFENKLKVSKKIQTRNEFLMYKNFKLGDEHYIDNYNVALKTSFKNAFYKYFPLFGTLFLIFAYHLILVFVNTNYNITMFLFYFGIYSIVVVYVCRTKQTTQYLEDYRENLLRVESNFISYLNNK